MKRTSLFRFLVFIVALSTFLLSCKKDQFITGIDARLYTSTDSLKFDTVFTSTGSVTKSFIIFNNNDRKLRLSRVKLMGGISSVYKMNVDGTATADAADIVIEANDSIYVFVTVTINPSAPNQPFIVKDSILINYNGNSRYVQLEAYGQNAVFLKNAILTGNNTWINTRPYVILGSLRVDTTASLTIQAGTHIYAHADAPILIDGTLIVNGTQPGPVVFAGDRLDPDYKDLPASWPGIYFRGNSKNSVLKFSYIKNAYQAIVVQQPSLNANAKLILHQCIVDNAYDAGILCFNTSLQADNSLISNCGSNVVISGGGDYTFTHCTLASYSNLFINHKDPELQISNFALQGATLVTANLNAIFRNSIFWGDGGIVKDEVLVSRQGNNPFNVFFDRSLIREQADPSNSTLTQVIRNQDPLFDSIDISKRIYNFRTNNPSSPGINKGILSTFTKDLDDKNRNNGLPDLGAYEKQ